MARTLGRLVFTIVSLIAALVAGMALLRRLVPSIGDEGSDEIRLVAIGDARALASRAAAFRGGSTLSLMGATRIDLRGATLDPGGARLRLQAYMSAVKVLVPQSWVVRDDIQASSSAVVNRTDRAAEAGAARADLVIYGTAFGSAVAVGHGSGECELDADTAPVSAAR